MWWPLPFSVRGLFFGVIKEYLGLNKRPTLIRTYKEGSQVIRFWFSVAALLPACRTRPTYAPHR